jgi:hypothetical protein
MDKNERQENSRNKENSSPRPDPGTTKTPDPQEKMEGPVSSPMHELGGAFDTKETQKQADEEREKNM